MVLDEDKLAGAGAPTAPGEDSPFGYGFLAPPDRIVHRLKDIYLYIPYGFIITR